MWEQVARRAPRARAALTAVLAAVYLAYAVGWTVAGLGNPFAPDGPLPAVLYLLGKVLAVLAPLVWFAACLRLSAPGRQRVAWLGLGLLLLAPLPLLVGVR